MEKSLTKQLGELFKDMYTWGYQFNLDTSLSFMQELAELEFKHELKDKPLSKTLGVFFKKTFEQRFSETPNHRAICLLMEILKLEESTQRMVS